MPPQGQPFKPDCSDSTTAADWYASLKTGTYRGNPPLLQWMGPAMWLHHEDRHFPFSFVRANGEAITPGTFGTDNNSTPALVLPRIGNWYYGGAYVPYSWIWHLRSVGLLTYSFEKANLILCEAVKTLQIKGFVGHRTFKEDAVEAYNIWCSVNSSTARTKWEEFGNTAP